MVLPVLFFYRCWAPTRQHTSRCKKLVSLSSQGYQSRALQPRNWCEACARPSRASRLAPQSLEEPFEAQIFRRASDWLHAHSWFATGGSFFYLQFRTARLFIILFVRNFWIVRSQFWLSVRNSRGNPSLCWLGGGVLKGRENCEQKQCEQTVVS